MEHEKRELMNLDADDDKKKVVCVQVWIPREFAPVGLKGKKKSRTFKVQSSKYDVVQLRDRVFDKLKKFIREEGKGI
jgi:hypothetical protein